MVTAWAAGHILLALPRGLGHVPCSSGLSVVCGRDCEFVVPGAPGYGRNWGAGGSHRTLAVVVCEPGWKHCRGHGLSYCGLSKSRERRITGCLSRLPSVPRSEEPVTQPFEHPWISVAAWRRVPRHLFITLGHGPQIRAEPPGEADRLLFSEPRLRPTGSQNPPTPLLAFFPP